MSKKFKFFVLGVTIVLLLSWLVLKVYNLAITAVQETIQTADYLIREEQRRDLVRFEDKLVMAEEHIDELQSELENIKVGQRAKLTTEEQKNKLLKIDWELRKDSWRIESAWLNHQNDFSVNLYPRKDKLIEEKFREYWRAHLLIDRVREDVERIVYSPQGVDKFQLEKIKEDLMVVKKILNISAPE